MPFWPWVRDNCLWLNWGKREITAMCWRNLPEEVKKEIHIGSSDEPKCTKAWNELFIFLAAGGIPSLSSETTSFFTGYLFLSAENYISTDWTFPKLHPYTVKSCNTCCNTCCWVFFMGYIIMKGSNLGKGGGGWKPISIYLTVLENVREFKGGNCN